MKINVNVIKCNATPDNIFTIAMMLLALLGNLVYLVPEFDNLPIILCTLYIAVLLVITLYRFCFEVHIDPFVNHPKSIERMKKYGFHSQS
jgi:hypothetical protein